MRSWVPIPDESDFPLENLPFGVFAPPGAEPRVGVAIGEAIVDLARLARAGLFDGVLTEPEAVFGSPSLNRFLALGRGVWTATRARVQQLLRDESAEVREHTGLVDEILVSQHEARMHLPVEVGDYVDFYSSIEHATNVGKIFRPNDPLLPNYRWIPVGYHGRASTLVVSPCTVRRPLGQTKAPNEPGPRFGPCRQLDFELEVGFIVGRSNDGDAIATSAADDYVFGAVLVNDWSARDVQAWEGQPLGPFLSKSFATSLSPWVVTLDALRPYRAPNRVQDPPPLDYLRVTGDGAFDIELSVTLEESGTATEITRVNFRNMYWNVAQQLAHLTSNGTLIRPGDLCASGTVSGTDAGTYGSLIEATLRGSRPIALSDGRSRTFLEDGDTVVLRGVAQRRGRPRIGFGENRGRVLPPSGS